MIAEATIHYTITYLLLFGIGFVFNAYKRMSSGKKGLYLVFSLGILAIMTMFRDFSIGNDTMTYIGMFRGISVHVNPMKYISSSVTEPGYVLFNWILSRITDEPRVLLVVSGAIIYFSLGRFLYRHAEAPGIFVLTFFALFTFNTYLSGMRQALSCAILLFAIDYAMEEKHVRMLLVVLLAATFHYSALVFIIMWFVIRIFNKDSERKYVMKLMVGTIAIMLCFAPVLSILLQLFPKYRYYLGDSYFDGQLRVASVLQFLVNFLLVATPSFIKKGYFEYDNTPQCFFKRFSLFGVVFIAISFNATILSRLGNIALLCVYVCYGNELCCLKNRRVLVILTIVLLYLYGLTIVVFRTPEWQTSFPYRFGWN